MLSDKETSRFKDIMNTQKSCIHISVLVLFPFITRARDADGMAALCTCTKAV